MTLNVEMDGPRLVRREELAAAWRLGALCFPGFVEEIDEEALTASYREPRRGGIQVICHRGVPVAKIDVFHSRVSVYGSPLHIGSIGGVCTHPDYRGLGLASRLLDHCVHRLVAEGARLMLVSGERELYRRAGCVPAQRFERVVLRPGGVCREAGGVSLRPAGADDAAVCARLYRQEPVRFVRGADRFLRHFERLPKFPRAGEWIVEARGRPVAYVFLAFAWEEYMRGGRDVLEAVEYAGDRGALVETLGELMARAGGKELRLLVPWQDEGLRRLLGERAIAGEATSLPGHTMCVVDLPGLMSDLRRYVRRRLEGRRRRGLGFVQEGGRRGIVQGRERIELDGAEMTRLVMGTPAGADRILAGAPGGMQEVAAALFPLPSLLPGLDYQ